MRWKYCAQMGRFECVAACVHACMNYTFSGPGSLAQAFNYLPLAALIDDRILVLHGGLGPNVETLDDIARIKKGKPIHEVCACMCVCQCQWEWSVHEFCIRASVGTHN
jgi:hypothetical protein